MYDRIVTLVREDIRQSLYHRFQNESLLPTNITRSAQTRSRENSLKSAMSAINQELDRLANQIAGQTENAIRKGQVGSGERSDKRRTIRFQDDTVIDHITNKRMTTSAYMKGRMDELWN